MSDKPIAIVTTLRAALKGGQRRAQSAMKPKNYEIKP